MRHETAGVLAPAKVNLTLHVTGRREDGYHLLDSLVVFCGVGDVIRVAPADTLSLRVTGPMGAGIPVDDSNLVLRAARLLDTGKGAAITLEKHLPMASGIGGGSSDAAATLRALAEMWGVPLPETRATMALGADLPVCMAPGAWRMQGLGEELAPLSGLPMLWMVLVNPGVPVSTPAVFKALGKRDNPPMPALPEFPDAQALADFVARQRNDLEPAARAVAPVIGDVVDAIAETDGCLVARMSGSGATCFGLYTEAAAAAAAADRISAARPEWWAAAGPVIG